MTLVGNHQKWSLGSVRRLPIQHQYSPIARIRAPKNKCPMVSGAFVLGGTRQRPTAHQSFGPLRRHG